MRRLLLLSVVLAFGCTDTNNRAVRLGSFNVTLLDTQTPPGTPEQPHPFAIQSTRDFLLNIQALDTNGAALANFNDAIRVSVIPGEVVSLVPAQPQLSGGQLMGLRVTIRKAFGPTRIWIEGNASDNRYAVGTSPALYFENPRVRDVQTPLSGGDSPLVGSIVSIDRGNNVVVHVSNNGFYVVDTDPIGGNTEYHSIFAFNFNRPEALRRGETLRTFGGNVAEFLGFTELGFPNWEVDHSCPTTQNPGQVCEEGEFCVAGACLSQECGSVICGEGSVCQGEQCVPNPNIPEPVTNPPFITAELEKVEGGIVRFTDVILTQEYVNCDDPAENPDANGNGVCEFCRTCNSTRDANGVCPRGGRCCLVGQVCNTGLGECTSRCTATRAGDGTCPQGQSCCPVGNTCDTGAGVCNGCTLAEKAEQTCDDACAGRRAGQAICSNTCDFREFGQYRVGLTTGGTWNGASFVMVSGDTVPFFRPDTPENRGKTLRSVTGVLRQVFAPGPIFILEPRDECDLDGIEHVRTDCATVR